MSRLTTEFPEANNSPGLALWRATNSWQAAQRAALLAHNLTHVQFVLLATLVWYEVDEPITQQDLASQARTDPMMTSQVVRALEAKGLIERAPHPTDARAKSLKATERGIELANTANVAVESVDREFFSSLGNERDRFTAMLNAITPAD